MKYLIPVIITASTLVAAALGAAAPATAEGAVAAMFPPWWGREQAVAAAAAADALILRAGAVGWIVIVRSDQPELAARLHDRGALLVVGSAGLGGCLQAS